MSFLSKAIISLRPGEQFSTDGDTITWHDTEQTQPSDSDIATKKAELEAEYNSQEYARKRAEAYASIGDQLDMQYHDKTTGTRTWLDHIEGIKDAHPKP